MAAAGQAHSQMRDGNHVVGLARIIHDGSLRNRAVALRDGHAEP